ncbi:DUF3291 domain-containing protein [Microlunatus flavus]|uniref:DUF3291 domain-containing protein n=1 Tax=Microlunatus flavus TaxID=1036181 RepID=A0A1H9IZL3_9ACTN|nr:DUF3291 domain-containing protein [Microlunatus flavus]SEQ79986.1 protein of unknown function [Microlunatus flavus]
MSAIALYTFGLLDPAVEPTRLADFVRRGGDIMASADGADGYLGRAHRADGGAETHAEGEDHGPWGAYALPDLGDFAGHDRQVHIATLSLWRDLSSARTFVYDGLHRDALRHRRDWFLQGSWPGHVLWPVADGAVPRWSDGVTRYEAMAREGESADRFTFGSRRYAA